MNQKKKTRKLFLCLPFDKKRCIENDGDDFDDEKFLSLNIPVE